MKINKFGVFCTHINVCIYIYISGGGGWEVGPYNFPHPLPTDLIPEYAHSYHFFGEKNSV